ncbi:SPX domain-containing protein [Thelephora terrestris]|uniref:SPX domain-containing protein n=1 Tax=Thelephora terrestris TaxID=56493 RepID=A0A9P6HIJ9_9AGAM|nr:SPX domain-containing protein [Thelephora terrestris]
MKFARYIEDTQVPEWKRAYIDYRGLKKLISTVSKQQEREDRRYRSSLYPDTPPRAHIVQFPTTVGCSDKGEALRWSSKYSPAFLSWIGQSYPALEKPTEKAFSDLFDPTFSVTSHTKTLCTPMQELPPKVSEAEMEFLVKLDAELEKVDTFYLDREKEVKEMLIELKRQLQGLKDHQKSCQLKSEERRLPLPLKFITSTSRVNLPPITAPDGRFGAMESRRAKRKLKKAVLEHYKKLDALQNFRVCRILSPQGPGG